MPHLSLVLKRAHPSPPQCEPLANWLRLCWIDLVVICLVIATIVYVLWGIPLTIRMWRMCRRLPLDTPSSSFAPTMRASASSRRNSLRPLHLRTASLPLTNEKRSPLPSQSRSIDPYLKVNPSLDDSLLLKEGLVEHTARPEPALNAYDAQPSFPSPPPPPDARRYSDATLTPGVGQGLGLRLAMSSEGAPSPTLVSPPMEVGASFASARAVASAESEEARSPSARAQSPALAAAVPPPPPAYSKYPIGQGKGRKNPYEVD